MATDESTTTQKTPIGLTAKIEKMEAQAKNRQSQKETAKVLYLPMWADLHRGSPNEIVRSALFNVRNRNIKRRYLEDEPIVVFGDGEITYRGQELRQDDEDVWLQLLHLVKLKPLGEWAEFTPYAMLKALSWPTNGGGYQRLRSCLSRLQATAVRIYSKRLGKGISLSLVKEFTWEDDEGGRLERWRVQISRDISQLFGEPYYSLLEWEQRKKLGPLAKWLHGFYASHQEPYPLKIETLQEVCGSEMAAATDFKKKLRRALNELKEVGFLKFWRIEKSLVYVKRV